MIIDIIKKNLFKRHWRRLNKHNETQALNIFSVDVVRVGKGSYGILEVYDYGNPDEFLEIGNFVSIAQEVKFVLGGNHPYKGLSTYPFKVKLGLAPWEATTKGRIIIGDDVWIGLGSIILSGVTIGKGAVIAAGSVVTKDIPEYSIAAGNPARVIKQRFSSEIASKVRMVDWEKLDIYTIRHKIDLLYKPLSGDNVISIISELLK